MSLNPVGLDMLNWLTQLDVSRFTGFANSYISGFGDVLEFSR